jgi:predicted nucleic acid-binding protein
MIYVFDSSFVGALIIPDEKNPQFEKLYRQIKHVDEKHAPHLLCYEMTNIFKNLIRRNRYSFEDVIKFYPLFAGINLIYDHKSGIEYSQKLLRLCNEYKLSSYDASYLELAERKNAVLCTLDVNLRAAAKKHGVAVIK